MDLLALSRAALVAASGPVSAVSTSDMSRPTPCGSWDLASLVGHMVAHNRGWVRAAAGEPADGSVWDSLSEPPSAFPASCAAVSEAFAACTLDRLDVYAYGQLSLSTALRMHIVDYVIHGWDVATSLGAPFEVSPDLAAAAYEIMLAFPDGPRPNKAFGVKVPVPPTATVMDKFLGYVGRDPAWKPSV